MVLEVKMSEPKILFITNHDFAGNYVAKIKLATDHNPPKPGTVCHVSIAHDDWCDMLAGRGPCNCDPKVTLLGREQ